MKPTVDATCSHSTGTCRDRCQILPGLQCQGKQACASPPLDFKRYAALGPMAAPRVFPGAPAPGTFQLHSRLGATKVIYLDFDGHVTQNTAWNSSNPTITTVAYDMDSNPGSFSAQEQANIVEMWQRVSECYSPFDVDVTTEAPTIADLNNSGNGDTKWGVRVLFGTSTPSPAPGAGGVAYIGGFGWDYGTGVDTPCFVLQQGMGTAPKPSADACVHEVGHTLGLTHDGLFPANDPAHVEYYGGQGTGKVAWAPHMGVGYYVPLVQFSKGEYANANNFQDDLQIIVSQNGFGYRPDDFTNVMNSAKAIPGTAGNNTFSVNVGGVVETNTDADWFKIISGVGSIKLDAVGGPANTMLDIQLSLYNSGGSLVATANPTTDLIASINQSVSGGTFYLKIEGVGNGNPATTGYSKYSSLGQYTITGSYSTKGIKGAPVLAGPGDLFYGIKSAPSPINPNITIADSDNTTQASASVKVSNFLPQDVLSLTVNPQTMGNITSSYDGAGLLILTSAGATASLDQFKAALRQVAYSNTSSNPTTVPRKIDFQVNDGTISSNVLTSTVTIGYTYVTAIYDSVTNTIIIADDPANPRDNAVVVTQRGAQIVVEAAGGTRIGTSASSAQSKAFAYNDTLKVTCNFSGGNDSISLLSLKSPEVLLNLGDGNDLANLTYCNIALLTVNGGPGADVLQQVGSTIGTKTLNSVP